MELFVALLQDKGLKRNAAEFSKGTVFPKAFQVLLQHLCNEIQTASDVSRLKCAALLDSKAA